MLPLARLETGADIRESTYSVDPDVMPVMNFMRVIALSCRAKARLDMFEACAMLSTKRDEACQAYVETLIRCFSEATGQMPKLFRPASNEFSFDESWLAAMIGAVRRDDDASLRFLVSSRVPVHARRNFAFLIRSIAERFYQV